MRILIITQKIDKKDDVLGFMHGWIAAFAKECDSVIALGLSRGVVSLPENVRVLSLGKELMRGVGKIGSRITYLARFYSIIWRERNNYDAVFVHMNYEYVILGGLLWRLWGKKMALWYAHGYVPPTLHIAKWLTHDVFTSTESGFRIDTPKKHVIGQAIDTEKFRPDERAHDPASFKILTWGRVSPSKDHATIIEAVSRLDHAGSKVLFDFIGKPAVTSDVEYQEKMVRLIAEKGLRERVRYVGSIANDDMPPVAAAGDLFINTGKTGSLDKTVLEAMSCALPILTSNEALIPVLGEFKEHLMFGKENVQALADKIEWLRAMTPDERHQIGMGLRHIVERDHSITTFVGRILKYLNA